jgi:hypothetical protein
MAVSENRQNIANKEHNKGTETKLNHWQQLGLSYVIPAIIMIGLSWVMSTDQRVNTDVIFDVILNALIYVGYGMGIIGLIIGTICLTVVRNNDRQVPNNPSGDT